MSDQQTEELVETETEAGAAAAAEQLLEAASAGEAARAMAHMGSDERRVALETLPPESAAQLLAEISDVQGAGILAELAPQRAAAILDRLPSDRRADLLGSLETAQAEPILDQMIPERARAARELVRYAPDVAGGLMVKEYLAFRQETTVADVLADLRRNADRYRAFYIQYVYITAAGGALKGVLRLRDLLLAPGDRPVSEIMIPDPSAIRDDAPLEEMSAFFDRYKLFGAPVVDGSNRLVGALRRHDVEQAWSARAGRDFMRSQGIVGEELRMMSLWRRASRRLSWLSINIGLNVMAASIIAVYQDTLSAVIALAVFLPIISDMSGCSGNQAVAVSMRELMLGLIKPADVLRVWWQEVIVGVPNGAVLGLLLGLGAWAWKGNAALGAVAGIALALNTVVAVSVGGIVPLILKALRVDPALASGPILTTITDMCGFFFVLSIASAVLPWLS
jgi:magnesium transporter